MCVIEALNFVLGLSHSDDTPPCVSPVLAEYARRLNDELPDEPRQRLLSLIPKMPGTAGDGREEARGYLALDWLSRTWLPTWLDVIPGCQADARALRERARIVNVAAAERSRILVGAGIRRANEWLTTEDAFRAAARKTAAWVTAGADASAVAASVAATAMQALAGSVAAQAFTGGVVRTAALVMSLDAFEATATEMQNSALDLAHRMVEVTT